MRQPPLFSAALGCQRWRRRRDSYRPAGEPIDTANYEVAAIASDAVAKAFVLSHHYSASYPAARFRFGLYTGGQLVGVAVFSVPCNDRAITNWFPVEPLEGVELGRFVLLDEVPANGESWFLARCRHLLRREGIRGVVSFCDPTPRTDRCGHLVFPGHVGTIYQASNAILAGRSRPATLNLLPDATVFSHRNVSKIRNRQKGWRYASAILEGFGAEPVGADADAWLGRWLPRLTRPLRHPGNYRYLFPIDPRVTRHLPLSAPYPKFVRPAPGAESTSHSATLELLTPS